MVGELIADEIKTESVAEIENPGAAEKIEALKTTTLVEEVSRLLPWERRFPSMPAPARRNDLARTGLLSSTESRARLFDGLRRTHGRILSTLPPDGHAIIAVCSALPGEGKTTIAMALAEMLSDDFSRQTLLIDGDLQEPQLDSLLDLHGSMGVKECLNLHQLTTQAIHWSGRLWVMPAGATAVNQDALSLDNQRNLLRNLRTLFRITVIDLPAVLKRPQGALLSLFADRVVWVVRADSSPVELVDDAMNMVGRDRILSVVLNQEKPRLPKWLGRLV